MKGVKIGFAGGSQTVPAHLNEHIGHLMGSGLVDLAVCMVGPADKFFPGALKMGAVVHMAVLCENGKAEGIVRPVHRTAVAVKLLPNLLLGKNLL